MITIVMNDQGDWIGIYDNEWLQGEGHSFDPWEVLKFAGVQHRVIQDVDLEPYGSHLPKNLNDLKEASEGE